MSLDLTNMSLDLTTMSPSHLTTMLLSYVTALANTQSPTHITAAHTFDRILVCMPIWTSRSYVRVHV